MFMKKRSRSLQERWLVVLDKVPQAMYPAAFLKWVLIGSVIGILSGSASAIFLKSLDFVTGERISHPWLLFFLPFGGALVSFLYMKYGGNAGKGNNLILESIQNGKESIPLRMAPLVLFGSLVTHLFGGSAGREGTAVQMGGSLAEWFGKIIKINAEDRRILLMCGISGGFGSIFGTPLAGTVFGLEVVAFGMMSYQALIPCFVASIVGDLVASQLWNVHHVHYSAGIIPELSFIVLIKVVVAAILFGLTARLFSELTHFLKKWFTNMFANPVVKSVVGGVIVIALVYIVGTRDYLGLGIPLAADSFQGDVSPFAFLWKLLFTALTLGTGFQGGEVTPLFVIGATLGHTLGNLLAVSVPFLAALGFVAVFSGAANTPIACFIMGIELFGSEGAIYMFVACIVSYMFSGHSGIYTSQQIGTGKSKLYNIPQGTTLAEWSQLRKTSGSQKRK
ncbi:H+/Cl-antiporter ClcA [Fontibacillus panacisegetis]|uniref:H+/Cl-antiporter ClcA n=2 Tax=Fontibacillus panacisegetis TaxID=670482 RepID=A0A1G7EE62_9BACL|nr:H+/Cl-antiporter ClcA [Fontibacillus panacisegetis]